MAKNLSDVLLGVSSGVLKVSAGGTGSTTSTGSGSVVLSTNPIINGLTIGSILPTSPVAGNIRFNPTSFKFEGYNGTSWSSVNGGLIPTTTKTANGYVASANDLVRCNTSGGAFSVTLPLSPVDGDVVGFFDTNSTFATYNLTILPNGKTIEGDSSSMILDVNGTYMSLTYVSATTNWRIQYTPAGTPPAATTSTLGSVKIDGTSITVNNGTISSVAPVTLDDISNQCSGNTSVFNLTANTVSINTLIDSKDLDVFVNGLKLSPYVEQVTYPWLSPVETGTGYRIRNLPSNTNTSTLVGKLIIYKAPFIGSTVLLTVRYSSLVKQTQKYPFNANTIALGD